MPTKKKTTYRFDAYVSEADHEPFILEVDGRDDIVIEQPTGASRNHFERAWRAGDRSLALWALAGDHVDELKEMFTTAPWGAQDEFIIDLALHFNVLPEQVLTGPGGGARFEADPRKVEKLLKQGWTLAEGKAGPTSPA